MLPLLELGPGEAIQRAEREGIPRLRIFKALDETWGVDLLQPPDLTSELCGYPSIAAREAATTGLAAVVISFSSATAADIMAFDTVTGLSKKVDALAMAGRVSDALAFYDRLTHDVLHLEPLDHDECRERATQSILDHVAGESRLGLIADQATERHQWGWLFFHRAPLDLDRGRSVNPPLIVDRFTGAVWPTGTLLPPSIYVAQYVATGSPEGLHQADYQPLTGHEPSHAAAPAIQQQVARAQATQVPMRRPPALRWPTVAEQWAN